VLINISFCFLVELLYGPTLFTTLSGSASSNLALLGGFTLRVNERMLNCFLPDIFERDAMINPLIHGQDIKYDSILKVNYNINNAILLVLIKLLSLFGQRDVYNVIICQSSCDKQNMTQTTCCEQVLSVNKL